MQQSISKKWYYKLHSAHRAGNIARVANAFNALEAVLGYHRAFEVAECIETLEDYKHTQDIVRIIPDSFTAFEFHSIAKNPHKLYKRMCVNKFYVYNRIRKQDEAPKAGADSSLRMQLRSARGLA